jgi:hypothetical protein
MSVFVLLLVVAFTVPARAQQKLPLLPEGPDGVLAHGKARRNTGIALIVLGSLNLAVAVGAGFGLGIPSSAASARGCPDCGLGETVALSIAIPSVVVGGTLLGVGIPLYVQGNRVVKRARLEQVESPLQ